ncbi:ATP-binding protein [Alicyclobacillus tolerans]|uniref:ATP-binding protein n=1 Tax=Alicyclobacillus tolerans TaxID=90970 RepID=UPI001F3CB8FA|nr:ATP-binding protein [Alicyclobacillus tolerans]MCF8567031.1 ATP-binding protein [Alicyclobacillus tolerans]
MSTVKALELYGLMGLMALGTSALPLIGSLFVFNYGRLILFLYRFVSPVLAVIILFHTIPNLLGQAVPGFTLQHAFHPMLTVFPWVLLYLVFWGITSFLSIGPPQWFLWLGKLQLKTTLRRRIQRGGDQWILKTQARARERREWAAKKFHMPFLAPHVLPKKSPVLKGHVQGRDASPRRWDRESVQEFFERNQAQTQARYQEEWQTSQRQREQENNMANGRVNWRPLGKPYSPHEHALERIFGMQEVLAEIERSIQIPLENPKLMREYDASMNAGILLYGPPGTGKTELARAVAEHLGLYFIAVRPSDLNATLVGATEQNIAALFQEAKEHAPAIIFIDEMDSIGSRRGSSHPYHDSQLTQLLTEMDGFEKREGVFVIGATNRLEALDEALLRGGRFGTQIEVPAPDEKALWNMFHQWASPLHLADDVYAVEIGLALKGQTGATLKALVEKLKYIEIQKRVRGETAIITRDEVFAEIEKLTV